MAVETGNELCVCVPRKLGTEKDNKGERHNAYRSFQRRTRAEDWSAEEGGGIRVPFTCASERATVS